MKILLISFLVFSFHASDILAAELSIENATADEELAIKKLPLPSETTPLKSDQIIIHRNLYKAIQARFKAEFNKNFLIFFVQCKKEIERIIHRKIPDAKCDALHECSHFKDIVKVLERALIPSAQRQDSSSSQVASGEYQALYSPMKWDPAAGKFLAEKLSELCNEINQQLDLATTLMRPKISLWRALHIIHFIVLPAILAAACLYFFVISPFYFKNNVMTDFKSFEFAPLYVAAGLFVGMFIIKSLLFKNCCDSWGKESIEIRDLLQENSDVLTAFLEKLKRIETSSPRVYLGTGSLAASSES